MKARFNIAVVDAAAYKAMGALETYLQTTFLSKNLKELIKIRASQINGCAYCIHMHTQDAIKYGENPQRIYLLNAWRETNAFSQEERVILAMTEEITLISQNGLTDETYAEAEKFFSQNEIAQIIMAISTINAWNRIGISNRLQPDLNV